MFLCLPVRLTTLVSALVVTLSSTLYIIDYRRAVSVRESLLSN